MASLDAVVRASEGLQSIRIIQPQYLEKFPSISGIALVAHSGAGKTTLVNTVRGLPGIDVPKRFLTRPPRLNDDLVENEFAQSKDEFMNRHLRGEIDIYWSRPMEQGREELYGFKARRPDEFVVYSGNLAFTGWAPYMQPRQGIVFVEVYADDAIREQRLRARSPDLVRDKPEEFQYRLHGENLVLENASAVRIRNNSDVSQPLADFRMFVERLRDARLTVDDRASSWTKPVISAGHRVRNLFYS